MGIVEAIMVILQCAKEVGGLAKLAEILQRHRDEILRMKKELPTPGKTKGT